jgi:hypothetical protein
MSLYGPDPELERKESDLIIALEKSGQCTYVPFENNYFSGTILNPS